MNCGLCIGYQGMKHDLKKQGFRRSYCPGCLPRGENCKHMRQHCELLAQGLVRWCFECAAFPCRRLKDLDRRYRTKYHMSMLDNLRYIQQHGAEAFLGQQAAEWRCPNCGETICCHVGLCLSCDLDRFRQNRKYRWGER